MVVSARGSRGFVVAAVMASLFMIAIEATIVATAMPAIVAQLGGMELYSWAFAGFLLAQTATTVVFGKLADLYGRKRIMLAGIAIFVTGLVLGGCAWSMPWLVVFRLVQGVGAGAVHPTAMTIVADLFPARERGKVQGYLASMWALAAVAGPIAGAAIVETLSWRWVFWINVPVGLVAAGCYIAWLREDRHHTTPSIDYAGAVLFTLAIGALMLAASGVGTAVTSLAWIAFGVFVVSTIAFVACERRARDPMVSFELWRRRPVASANAVAMLAGMSLMGLTAFLPMYVQTVMQRTPLVAGLALAMMLLGWPVGAALAARVFHRLGLRNVLVTGSLLQPLGALCFVFLTPQSAPALAYAGSALMGFGMGLLSVTCLVLIQEAAEARERGSATASNLFARNLGSALGATAFGVVVNVGLAGTELGSRVTAEDLRRIVETPGQAFAANPALLATLASALHAMFVTMFVVAVLTAAAAQFVPDTWFPRRRDA